MRACDLCQICLVALGVCIACVCAVQASETLPIALVSTPSPVATSQELGMAPLAGSDEVAASPVAGSTDAATGSLAADDPLEDYDPLFDDEIDLELAASGVGDPFESFNRHMFSFNETLDTVAWDPMTRGYQFLVPEPVRRGIHRVFLNLESPVILVNQLFQLRFKDAANTTARFLINSTAGAAGFFDAAGAGAGMELVGADFGQTLARYGMPSGAFLVVPLFGPTTVRDLSGDVVDRLFDPLTYVVGPIEWWIVLGASEGLALREAHSEALDALEASSIDFYSALRSAYHQSREAEIRRARGKGEDAADEPIAVGFY
jgi:phospholipid-binding lipoprotein MlaA